MTVSHGVEEQLISEARICIYSDIKALNAVYISPRFAKILSLLNSNCSQIFHSTDNVCM